MLELNLTNVMKFFYKAPRYKYIIKKLREYYAKKELQYFDNHLPNNPGKYITFDYSNAIHEPNYLIYHIPHLRIGDQCPYWVPVNSISEGDIRYSFGVGEEISFEVELAKCHKTKIFLFDPSPNSARHIDLLFHNTEKGEKTFHSQNRFDDRCYDISKKDLDLITFSQVGISEVDREKEVYFTRNDKTFSLYKSDFFSKKNTKPILFRRLVTLMKEKGHKEIHLLKLDVEGEEHNVISDMIKENIRPKILVLEFHIHKLNRDFRKSVERLLKYGYLLTFRRGGEFTFVEIKFYKHLYRLMNYNHSKDAKKAGA